MLERVLVCLVAGGHLLIEGVPGLAKTLTIKTTASVLGGTFRRIQFTPDLVPSDLVGTRIYRPDQGGFETDLGPVFCNFLLADEINRAPAKVQSALLEVMQERQVTIGHDTHLVPQPFLVMATQNPIESEGTYPLPEAQVDRFMLKVLVGYPERDEELTVVNRSLDDPPDVRQVLPLAELAELQQTAKSIYVDPGLVSYAVSLAAATREPATFGLDHIGELVAYGASPRGPIALVQSARALALVHGRDYVIPADIRALAKDAFRHRLVLTYQALAEERSADDVLDAVLAAVPQPRLELGRPAAAADAVLGVLKALGAEPTPSKPGPGQVPESLLKALELTIARRVEGLLAGDHRSALLGRGTELAQVRPYVPGDDVRLIDWNVTARTTEPHVRVHLAERVLVTWIVLDTTPSMAFGTAERRKADVALGATLAVGHAATVRGNRVGLVGFGGDGVHVVPPRQGRAGLVGLLLALRDGHEPAETLIRNGSGPSPLAEALRQLGAVARQRALVVVVSDFRGERDWRRPLLEVAGRHEVVAVEVGDPREQALEPAGTLFLVDPETGRELRVDTSDARLRARFAEAAAEERAAVARELASAGVAHVALTTDRDWLRDLAVFVRRRRA